MVNIINLSYLEHKKYYELYSDNNDALKKIIQENRNAHNFDNDHKKYYQLNDTNIITRNFYESDNIIIQLNSIMQKDIYGYCIKTGEKYLCEKMHYSSQPMSKFYSYTYHFNCNNDEFIIFFSWEYFSPFFIYYPKTRKVYNISYRYKNISENLNLDSRGYSVIKNINFKKTHYNENQNYMSYAIGIMANPGHYFWNEIIGLMMLIDNNLLDNIDEFLIYKYDYLKIGDILKNRFNKRVTYIADLDKHNITCNVTKHFVTDKLIDLFRTFYNLNVPNKITNNINILFDLRSNSRVWLNQNIIIKNIIYQLKQRYGDYNVNFYISGFYSHLKGPDHNYNTDKEVTEQNAIFNEIQRVFDFKINNLINKTLPEIIKVLLDVDLVIGNSGSGAMFMSAAIFNKHMIAFTNTKLIEPFTYQRYAFENKLSNTYYLDKSYIVDDKNGNFFIRPHILLDEAFSTINNKILDTKIYNS